MATGTASGAADVMPAVVAMRPDVVVVDAVLDQADGVAECRDIRRDERLASQPYVVVLTAHPQRFAGAAAPAGVDLVMGKPVAGPALLDQVAQVERSRR